MFFDNPGALYWPKYESSTKLWTCSCWRISGQSLGKNQKLCFIYRLINVHKDIRNFLWNFMNCFWGLLGGPHSWRSCRCSHVSVGFPSKKLQGRLFTTKWDWNEVTSTWWKKWSIMVWKNNYDYVSTLFTAIFFPTFWPYYMVNSVQMSYPSYDDIHLITTIASM